MTEELQVWALVLSVVLPLLVGLVTKASWSPSVRAVLLLALATVTSLVEEIVAAGGSAGFEWRSVLLGALTSFGIGVLMHFGLWRPTGASDAAKGALVKDRYALAG